MFVFTVILSAPSNRRINPTAKQTKQNLNVNGADHPPTGVAFFFPDVWGFCPFVHFQINKREKKLYRLKITLKKLSNADWFLIINQFITTSTLYPKVKLLHIRHFFKLSVLF